MPRTFLRSLTAACALAGGVLLTGCGSATLNAGTAPSPEPSTSAVSQFAVPAFLQRATTSQSWNPNVSCRATVTTLRHILGTQRSQLGGATFEGGGFKPGIPDRRALYPPCVVNGVPTYIQLNNVHIASCSHIGADGDWTCPVTDPSLDGPLDMRRIVTETDQKFQNRPGWTVPPGGPIRIQGFVFWDPGHTSEAWHNHSGWEIHSFTAWRPVQ